MKTLLIMSLTIKFVSNSNGVNSNATAVRSTATKANVSNSNGVNSNRYYPFYQAL